MKEPIGKGWWRKAAAKMRFRPRIKQLKERALVVTGKELGDREGSARVPTLTAHRVATAITSQSRSTRAGWVILVCSQRQPPRLRSLKAASSQARRPYHRTQAWSAPTSVTMSQGSWSWSCQQATKVQASRAEVDLKHRTRRAHNC